MKHIGLFEGIGGFSLAAKWAGWETIAWCEWNEFGQKVLRHHFPEAEGFGDITKTDFTKYANRIDILTGGFPCQPYSLAGKRKGKEDERHLWPEMLRAIREIQPSYVVGENVGGLINWNGGMVFDEVQIDLEAEGYEVLPFLLPACAKNAPHRRDRCWFIAQNSLFRRCLHGESNQEGAEVREFGDIGTRSADGIHLSKRDATHTNGIGCGGRSEQSKSNQSEEREICENEQQHRDGVRCEIEGCSWDVTNTENIGRKNALENGELERGRFRLRDKPPTWDSFPSQSPICGGDDGISYKLDSITFSKWRGESIKAYGNAIVPQVAYEIFKVINQMNETHNF